MKRRLSIFWTISVLLGLAFGLQQTTSILLSSFHDLATFPKTSLVAVAFILWFHALFWGLFGLVFGWLIEKFGREGMKKDKFTIPLAFGLGAGLVVFVFLFGRFHSVFNKKIIKFLLLGVSLGVGGISAFFVYPSVVYFQKKRRLWKRMGGLSFKFTLGAFVLLTLGMIGVGFKNLVWGAAGLPKKPRVNQVATANNPNVILLTIDALRADHLGFMGYEKEGVSPNLDLIASQGVVFENAYANAPWTLPSLSSMFSSRMPTELKISVDNLSVEETINSGFLTSQVETISERLQTLGYNTQAILTNEWLTKGRGFDQGFDGFVNLEKLMPYHYHFHFKNMALTLLAGRVSKLEAGLEKYYTFLVGPSGSKQFKTKAWEINRLALPFLENYQNVRFFTWLHYIDPHAPYDPGGDYSPDLSAIGAEREKELRVASAHDPDQIRWREADKQALVDLYDGDISLVDAAVGEVWQKIEELGLRENTVLIITADHGEEFWDHGALGHGRTLYRETIKVPLIIVGPEIGVQKITNNVSLLDIYPTIVDLAQGSQPKSAQGQSLKPLLERGVFLDKTIISEGTGRGTERRAIIADNNKLIHDFFTSENEFYDIYQDLKDQNNIVGFKTKVAADLEVELKNRVEKYRENREEIFKQKEASRSFGDVVGY